jgi:UDP-N-acetylglucosamine 1-carboxyvinyltransferase
MRHGRDSRLTCFPCCSSWPRRPAASVLIHQKMFESRLFFVDKLIDMGAQIILCDPHRAVVVGQDHRIQLRSGRMTSPDIRAGIALLIAAHECERHQPHRANIAQIDRGYEDIETATQQAGR